MTTITLTTITMTTITKTIVPNINSPLHLCDYITMLIVAMVTDKDTPPLSCTPL